MDLADRIRSRMSELNLTQEALANQAEISQAMVYKLLARKSKSTTKIIQLANALECSVEWLAIGEDIKHGIKEDAASYGASRNLTALELEQQLKALSKEQQKRIALSIMQDLMVESN